MDFKWADNFNICQSWMVDTPPWNGVEYNVDPMSVHSHFMSIACSTYYLKHQKGFGGDLRFENPICAFIDFVTEFNIMERLEPNSGVRNMDDIEVEESDIVIFPRRI